MNEDLCINVLRCVRSQVHMQCDGKKALRGTSYENCSNSYLANLVLETYPHCLFGSHIYFTIHNIQKCLLAKRFDLLPGEKTGSFQLAILVIIR